MNLRVERPPSHEGVRPAVGALALFSVLALLAVSALVYRNRTAAAGPILLMGDSLTVVSRDALLTEIGPTRTVEVAAVGGARIPNIAPTAETKGRSEWWQVAIDIGTNDMTSGVPPAEVVQGIAVVAASFPRVSCVHLVTINERILNLDGKDWSTPAKEINRGMRALADSHGYKIIEWAGIVNDHLDRGEPDGPLLTDTVHPGPVGQRLLAQAYADSINSC